jgi:hypothetical protein
MPRYRSNGRFAPTLWSVVRDDGKWATENPLRNVNAAFTQAERELRAVMRVVKLAHVRHHPLQPGIVCNLCKALDTLENVRQSRKGKR